MTQGTVSISIDDVRLGATCSHPIEDDRDLLLLGANTRITQQVVNGLRDRGIDVIEVDPRDLAALRGETKKKVAVVRERASEPNLASPEPVKDMLVDRHDEALSDQRTEQLHQNLGSAKERFQDLQVRMTVEKIRSVRELDDVTNEFAQSLIDDHDQTVGVIGRATSSADAGERSVRMSVLGMAVAVEMGLNGKQTLEVGMTALLHDIGLCAMDSKFQKPVAAMSEAERWEYRKHPLVSVLCISDVMEVPASVQLAMQQVHEQYDGSGYPRGVKGQRIHTYARILNVVDAYLQLTTATPDRSGIVPHDALGLMLHQASRGLFDPKVIRAFLSVETLFPLGSMVEIGTGESARVIRRPRNGFAAPVLQDMEGNRIELESGQVEVVRPSCDFAADQMRLTPETMQSSQWHPDNHCVLV